MYTLSMYIIDSVCPVVPVEHPGPPPRVLHLPGLHTQELSQSCVNPNLTSIFLKTNPTIPLITFYRQIFEFLKKPNFSGGLEHNVPKFGVVLVLYYFEENTPQREVISRDKM